MTDDEQRRQWFARANDFLDRLHLWLYAAAALFVGLIMLEPFFMDGVSTADRLTALAMSLTGLVMGLIAIRMARRARAKNSR